MQQKEADQFMANAEKAMNQKTMFGFGKVKPDYDIAVDQYTQAANLYRSIKNNEKAIHAFIKAAECHYQLNSTFLAGKSYETAANLSPPSEASVLYKKASDMFIVQGSPDRAAEMLEKAAKNLETSNRNEALEYYKESCNLYEQEDRLRFGIETFKRAIAFCVKSEMWSEAVKMSEQLELAYIKLSNRPYAFRQVLTNIVIHLYQKNLPLAQESFGQACTRNPGIHDAEEGRVIVELFQAFESGEQAVLDVCLKSSAFKFLDVEIAKIAKKLVVPEVKNKVAPIVSTEQTKQEIVDLQDEVEEEGFL